MPTRRPSRPAAPNYASVRLIVSGGTSNVYQAIDISSGEAVALKTLKPELSKEPRWNRRFEFEAGVGLQLNHPNIAPTLSFSKEPSPPFIVMHWIHGTPLAIWMQEVRPSHRHRIDMLCQLADALAYIHKMGFVHGDIKPDNILISDPMVKPQGREGSGLQLIDLGGAQILGSKPKQDDLVILGSGQFIPPEKRLSPSERVSATHDVFSFGVLARWLLNHEPFLSNEARIIRRTLRPIIARCCAPKRSRYVDGSALLRTLRETSGNDSCIRW